MQIINHQLLATDGVTVIAELPKLAYDATVQAWEVPTEYRENGFYVSTGNDIPACDHDAPVFSEELKADEATKLAHEFDLAATRLNDSAQRHLDSVAATKGYDSLISAASYATSSNTKFKADGIAAIKWRDAVWIICHAALTDAKSGAKPVPTEGELLASLPTLNW